MVSSSGGFNQDLTVSYFILPHLGDYSVFDSFRYAFKGFFQPVDNSPTLNLVKAGQGIPIKFSLSGYFGLGILFGYPNSQQIACDSSDPVDTIEETTTANTGLTYDVTSDQYIYVLKTQKSWAGTCRQLDLRLIDGTEHIALFSFK